MYVFKQIYFSVRRTYVDILQQQLGAKTDTNDPLPDKNRDRACEKIAKRMIIYFSQDRMETDNDRVGADRLNRANRCPRLLISFSFARRIHKLIVTSAPL